MLNGEPMKTTRLLNAGVRLTGGRFSGGLMKSQKEKTLGGELYDPLDSQLCAERRARLLFKALNNTADDQQEERARLIKELIPSSGEGVWIEPPFYCDYGTNITIGDRVFFNFNCVVLDVV